jgi:hypothetical protein
MIKLICELNISILAHWEIGTLKIGKIAAEAKKHSVVCLPLIFQLAH